MASELHDHLSSLLSDLEDFRALVNDISRLSTQGGLEEAVHSAYNICCTYNDHDFEGITHNISRAGPLRNALSFLGRLNTCFKTLIRAAERLSNFQGLRILPVTILPASRVKSKKEISANNWSVTKTFSSLGLNLDERTVKSIFTTEKKKNPWTKRKLLQDFDNLKSPVSEVHAEVQVLLAAARHDCRGASTFNYVGCSKLSCFLCSKFLQRYGQFNSRGSHGKLYDLWTVPEVPWLAEEKRRSLGQILEDIGEDLKDSIQDKKTKKLLPEKESTVGCSSLATIEQHSGSPYTMPLASQHLQAQRENIVLAIRDKVNFQESR